jgi:hypothetical protein
MSQQKGGACDSQDMAAGPAGLVHDRKYNLGSVKAGYKPESHIEAADK